MKIILDDEVVEIFSGARVKDVLLKFSSDALEAVVSKKLQVIDRWGNPVDLEGQLSENQQLHLQNIPNVPEDK